MKPRFPASNLSALSFKVQLLLSGGKNHKDMLGHSFYWDLRVPGMYPYHPLTYFTEVLGHNVLQSHRYYFTYFFGLTFLIFFTKPSTGIRKVLSKCVRWWMGRWMDGYELRSSEMQNSFRHHCNWIIHFSRGTLRNTFSKVDWSQIMGSYECQPRAFVL